MISLLQRLGHRESVVGFVVWSLFAVFYLSVAVQLLGTWIVSPAIPIAAAFATVSLGVVMGRSTARRSSAVGISFVVLNALPLAVGGAIVTAFTPTIGWPLLAAPLLLGVGGLIGTLVRRGAETYMNPGNALAGAAAALAVFLVSSWLALSAMDAAWGRAVVEVRTYATTYDCVDSHHMRLLKAIRSMASQFNRDRLSTNQIGGQDLRPCPTEEGVRPDR